MRLVPSEHPTCQAPFPNESTGFLEPMRVIWSDDLPSEPTKSGTSVNSKGLRLADDVYLFTNVLEAPLAILH